MVNEHMHSPRERSGGKVAKEFLAGLLAISIGVYNLLSEFGLISWNITVPRLLGSILLIIVGVLLWTTAYKLWRYRWHTSRLF